MAGDGLNSPRRGFSDNEEDSIFPNKHTMRKTSCLTVTMQNLTDVPRNIFELAREEYVNMVDLSKNRLTTIPEGLQELKDCCSEIVFANNLIDQVPPHIAQFTRLAQINLSCNSLRDLPPELGLLKTLRELNISNNCFEILPSCLYKLKDLEILLACDNRIKTIDASKEGLGAIKRLATLDLRNNNIDYVPPILGNLKNLTRLEIHGNPFKLPRYQTMEKGTEAIMSYLRGRIPSNEYTQQQNRQFIYKNCM